MPATKANTLKSVLQSYIAANHSKPHDTVLCTLALLLDPHAQMSISPEQELMISFSDGSKLTIDDIYGEQEETNPILWC